MFMDFETNARLQSIMVNLASTAKEMFDVDVDLILTETDKYENTAYETTRVALGVLKGVKTEQLHQNKCLDNGAIEHYERNCENILYEIVFNPLQRTFKVYEIGYTGIKGRDGNVVRTLIDEVQLGKSKLAKKLEQYDKAQVA